ncbi:polysaccharide deacetylase family protein [Peribacillus frigoritolerans]|uniref:polysaccharide deacetylase family protein n=1 Tax=Peribacillus frigoritolerans TaxID=450367 RepID=UPI00105A1EC2|nr:polysaccharide deacetylase family protein [Peribacillus frigoritolerans]TDL76092.1 polysaccharide deacetylase [Peribacillus frigoritolerans]
MKYFFMMGGILFVLYGGYNLFTNLDTSKVAMEFPERLDKNGCLGLTYHRILDDNTVNKTIEFLTASDELTKYNVYKNDFIFQIDTLERKGANFLNPDEVLKAQKTGIFPENCVWISFDDVDTSVYLNAFPILEKKEIPFTLFIIAGQVGKNFNNLRLASWGDLKEMKESGLATIGSHTFNMHELENNEPIFFQNKRIKEFEEDLILSKSTIKRNLSMNVKHFAYPYGNGKVETAAVIQEEGFKSASILAPRSITSENDPYWLNRILVDQEVFDDIVNSWIE